MKARETAGQQHHRARFLLIFGGFRIAAWTVLFVLVCLGLLGVGGTVWAADLSKSIPFVALISIYANWATDLDGFTASYAALIAAETREDEGDQ